MFWSKMIMQYGIKSGSAIMLFVGFAVWSCATFAVLLAMDVLECFLHALRLHWVEFQNSESRAFIACIRQRGNALTDCFFLLSARFALCTEFYHADGYAFAPFAFTVTEII